jgi:hypothetical protein
MKSDLQKNKSKQRKEKKKKKGNLSIQTKRFQGKVMLEAFSCLSCVPQKINITLKIIIRLKSNSNLLQVQR